MNETETQQKDREGKVAEKLDKRSQEQFSLAARAKSFTHAGRGIKIFLRSTHNAWLQIVVFALVVILGCYFNLSLVEWAALVAVSGLVLTAEAFNTALEIDIDLTSPEYHPAARDTKDIAAGAVLIASITAALVGALIFIRHFIV